MAQLSNFTYDEIYVGQTASYSKTIEERDIQLFAAASGDVNPVHLDETFAAATMFGGRIAHGMLTGALVSAAIALELPGPGTIYRSQSLRFRAPVKIGDTITIKLEVTKKKDRSSLVILDCKAFNQHEKLVATGLAEAIAPPAKLVLPKPPLPTVTVTG
jgi:3-hydroxybutyryl-CoA dehydratase